MGKEEEKNRVDLELVPTGELIDEVVLRHEEAIVIRRNIKDPSLFNINYKTNGLLAAFDMLNSTGRQLAIESMEKT